MNIIPPTGGIIPNIIYNSSGSGQFYEPLCVVVCNAHENTRLLVFKRD